MPTTEQLFSDHLDIQRVILRYAKSIDNRQWQLMHDVFTDEATGNYEGIGVFEGRAAITAMIESVIIKCGMTQHLLGNIDIDVNGDQASATCYLLATHAGLGDYAEQIYTVWGEYKDTLVKTGQGWRISQRTLTPLHATGDIGL